jgi:hypothetical protein
MKAETAFHPHKYIPPRDIYYDWYGQEAQYHLSNSGGVGCRSRSISIHEIKNSKDTDTPTTDTATHTTGTTDTATSAKGRNSVREELQVM